MKDGMAARGARLKVGEGKQRPERGSATRSKPERKVGVVRPAAARADVLRVIDPRSEKAPGRPFPSFLSSPTFNHTRSKVGDGIICRRR